ncbi:sarcosine oxidase subunit gamma [Sphingomonas canadensis]|uniref:Sarcosine oxidase subunit gamma n=1 Tax=Sphingomonas canadensis TaxID=1219257 RepID=A0ABW3HB34_9SPHN|nr:sarcosine oxidase subunit gamma family protein [Sphingomonas canadensis]MCW3836957.1 sarcosine oxidase, gamma subunit [Sphingomonas canadensis]
MADLHAPATRSGTPGYRRLSLRLRPESAPPALAGLPLPRETGAVSDRAGLAILTLGPGEWLLIGEPGAVPSVAAAGDALGALPHSAVDVSERQIGFTLSGPGAAEVLAAGCPLDLDSAAFPPGRATRTLFHKAEVVLWRQAADRFHIEVWRSFAPYAAALIDQAIADESFRRDM